MFQPYPQVRWLDPPGTHPSHPPRRDESAETHITELLKSKEQPDPRHARLRVQRCFMRHEEVSRALGQEVIVELEVFGL